MESQIARRIRKQWSELTKSDRMVARRLLSEYPTAGLKTLAELAGRTGVSAPTVIRCVKKLGFDSYPDFQRALHEEIQGRFDRLADDSADIAGPAVADELEQSYVEAVRKTMSLIRQSEVEQPAAALARSRASVLCLGGRVSQALAMIFQARLLRLRKNVELVSSNPIERSERLMDVGKNDVVVVFDYAPYDSGAASFARLAREKRASVICFTDVAQSPAAEYSEFVVAADVAAGDGSTRLSPALCSAEVVLQEVRSRIGARARSRSKSLAGAPHHGSRLQGDPA